MNKSGTGTDGDIYIQLDPSLRPFAPAAVLRLSYTEPDISAVLETDGSRISWTGRQESSLVRKRIMHAIYREKILAETSGLRAGLLSLLAAR